MIEVFLFFVPVKLHIKTRLMIVDEDVINKKRDFINNKQHFKRYNNFNLNIMFYEKDYSLTKCLVIGIIC